MPRPAGEPAAPSAPRASREATPAAVVPPASAPSRPAVVSADTRAAVVLARLRAGERLTVEGSFADARRLLDAVTRRATGRPPGGATLAERFHRGRAARLDQRRTLGRLGVTLGPGWTLALGRAPDVRAACEHAFGAWTPEASWRSLRELTGALGAHGWYTEGVRVPGLEGRLHPWYGVFAPTRGEVGALLAAELDARPATGRSAFDIGTGTGLLGLMAAQRGASRVVGTDVDARAVACARENAARLGLEDRFQAVQASLFPEGRADLVLCNPPWLPGAVRSALDGAVYDPDHRFLTGLLEGAGAHLAPGGELWVLLGDLPERLGLRGATFVDELAVRAGLVEVRRREAPVAHPRSQDPDDPLHAARRGERLVLRVLRAAG